MIRDGTRTVKDHCNPERLAAAIAKAWSQGYIRERFIKKTARL